MNKIILILLMIFASSFRVNAQVTFTFDDGIDNVTFKSSVEKNVSALLTEINRADGTANANLNLTKIKIRPQAASGLRNLWSNMHFRCEQESNIQSCLEDATGYEIRQIPVEIRPLDDTYSGDLHKELTISFDRQGYITGVRMAIDNNSYMSLFSGGTTVRDERLRREILKFVEDFRSYYEEKDINALDNIFSNDALIITGRVIRTVGTSVEGNTAKVKETIKYSKKGKKEYLSNLQDIFQKNKYIKVDFSDIQLMRHSSKSDFYGVRLRQKWDSQRYNGMTYGDDGYIFLLWDFTDEENPKIHVRAWAPNTPSFKKDDFLSPEDFFIPD